MNISVVIPVYNGALTLKKLTHQLIDFFKDQESEFEIIFVFDGGNLEALDELKKLKNDFQKIITIVELSRNYGQHNAIICGFSYCKFDFILTMDEDLQHSPFDIIYLIQKQSEYDYDVVYGTFKELKHSFFRRCTSSLLRKILVFSIPDLNKDYSPFRFIKREIALEITKMNNAYSFIDGYLSWVTNKSSSVIISHQKRENGKSAYSIKKLMEHSINILITFSKIPIKILSYSSVIIFLITLIYATYIVIRKFFINDFIPGYPSIMILLGFGFSLVLLAMSILGEYIYTVNLKNTKRPNFIIRKIY